MTDLSSHPCLLRSSCSPLPPLNKVVSLPTKSGYFLLAFRGLFWLRSNGVEGLGEGARAWPLGPEVLPLGEARLSSLPQH